MSHQKQSKIYFERSGAPVFQVNMSFAIANTFSKKYNFIIQKTSFIVAKTITMLFYKKGTINLGNNTKKFEIIIPINFVVVILIPYICFFATINEVFLNYKVILFRKCICYGEWYVDLENGGGATSFKINL